MMPVQRSMSVTDLLKQAEREGLRLEHDSGFTVLVRTSGVSPSEPEEEALLRELATRPDELNKIALGRARLARASKLIGRGVFDAERLALGVIERADGGGFDGRALQSLLARYPGAEGGGVQSLLSREAGKADVNFSVGAEEVLLILGRHDTVESYAGFPVTAGELTRQFVERAEGLGVRFGYHGGFVEAQFDGDGVTFKTIENLDLPNVRKEGRDGWMLRTHPWTGRIGELWRLLVARARAARGAAFVGCDVFAPEAAAAVDGADLKASVVGFQPSQCLFAIKTRYWSGGVTIQVRPDRLIFVRDESAPTVAKPATEKKARFRVLGRR